MGNPTVVSLKLLINTQTKQVLFAEAGKDLVDFLFSILSLPVANVISLVHKQSMMGSLSNLYDSVQNLNETYIQPNQDKTKILKPPRAVVSPECVPHLLLPIEEKPNTAAAPNKYYRCSQHCTWSMSDDPRATCPHCKRAMTTEVAYVAPPASKQQVPVGEDGGGFVKGVVTYMVTDDLVVTPMSMISSITVLNKFNVKDIAALEEKLVDFGMDQALKLMRSSLETKNVLTNVFLK